MPKELLDMITDWLHKCPEAEFHTVNYIEEDTNVWVMDISVAICKPEGDH